MNDYGHANSTMKFLGCLFAEFSGRVGALWLLNREINGDKCSWFFSCDLFLLISISLNFLKPSPTLSGLGLLIQQVLRAQYLHFPTISSIHEEAGVLASSSGRRRAMIWGDLSRLLLMTQQFKHWDEQTDSGSRDGRNVRRALLLLIERQGTSDGPPELVFAHCCRKSRTTEFAWSNRWALDHPQRARWMVLLRSGGKWTGAFAETMTCSIPTASNHRHSESIHEPRCRILSFGFSCQWGLIRGNLNRNKY